MLTVILNIPENNKKVEKRKEKMENRKVYEVGNTIFFVYNGKTRYVTIEKVVRKSNFLFSNFPVLITGWDYSVLDSCEGGYRSFKVDKIMYATVHTYAKV
jgi:hypothetical protein